MSRKRQSSGVRFCRLSLMATAVAVALGASAPSQSFEFASGVVTGSFDTTVSLGARWRMEKPDPALIGIANGGTARSVNEDDGNQNWDRGDLE